MSELKQIELVKAAAEGDFEKIINLVEQQEVDVNCRVDVKYPASQVAKTFSGNDYLDIKSSTPIIEAISHGHLEIAEYFLSKNADIYARTADGFSAAHLSAYLWQPNSLEWLIFKKGFSIFSVDIFGKHVVDATRGGVHEGGDVATRASRRKERTTEIILMSLAKDLSVYPDAVSRALLASGVLNKFLTHSSFKGIVLSILPKHQSILIKYLTERFNCDFHKDDTEEATAFLPEDKYKEYMYILRSRPMRNSDYRGSPGENLSQLVLDEFMFDAASEGQLNRIQILFDRGADPNAKFVMPRPKNCYGGIRSYSDYYYDWQRRDDQTPLHFAAKSRRFEAVKLLLQLGADATAKDYNGLQPIHLAIDSDSDVIVEHFIKSEDKNIRNPFFILRATVSNSSKVLIMLVKLGADINTFMKKDGKTAMHYAVEENRLAIAKLLIQLGFKVSVNKQDQNGQTALHLACKQGELDLVRTLLEIEGIDAGLLDGEGRTALSLAPEHAHEDIANEFLKVADTSMTDKVSFGM